MAVQVNFKLKKKIGGHLVLFVGPLIPLFYTSGGVSFGFQSQSFNISIDKLMSFINLLPYSNM